MSNQENSETVVIPAVEIQKEHDGTYGVGQVIVPGVRFFAASDHGLTKDKAEKRAHAILNPPPKKEQAKGRGKNNKRRHSKGQQRGKFQSARA